MLCPIKTVVHILLSPTQKKSVLIQNKLCTDFAGLSFPAAIATAVFWAAQIL